MMPLAFDLTSILDTGSIFPVATTDRTISPRATAAIFSAGIDSSRRNRMLNAV